MVYTYNGILFSLKKGGNSALYDKMDEPWGHFTVYELSQPEKDKYCMLYLSITRSI